MGLRPFAFLAIEKSAGGRHALKSFVKACHQRGIAVLMDVVYNNYTQFADRAAWKYDSDAEPRNWHYWYEGQPAQYAEPSHGYVQNVSSGAAPRYCDEYVRAMFVSSAVMLVDEFHIDGLRVDQTTSRHAYNRLNYDGAPSVPAANISGRKLLRELCQTLKVINPGVFLIAEDHSGWHLVTQPAPTGGMGFDATWYSGFSLPPTHRRQGRDRTGVRAAAGHRRDAARRRSGDGTFRRRPALERRQHRRLRRIP